MAAVAAAAPAAVQALPYDAAKVQGIVSKSAVSVMQRLFGTFMQMAALNPGPGNLEAAQRACVVARYKTMIPLSATNEKVQRAYQVLFHAVMEGVFKGTIENLMLGTLPPKTPDTMRQKVEAGRIKPHLDAMLERMKDTVDTQWKVGPDGSVAVEMTPIAHAGCVVPSFVLQEVPNLITMLDKEQPKSLDDERLWKVSAENVEKYKAYNI